MDGELRNRAFVAHVKLHRLDAIQRRPVPPRDVGGNDAGALRREPARDGGANAGQPARDDGDLPSEPRRGRIGAH